ncbi:MAG: hypothetical protein ACYCTH_05260, partial [Cellulomonas sp.]
VTGTNMFARSIGSAVGVAVLGAVVNGMLRGQDATSDPHQFGLAVTWVFVALAATAVMLVVAGLAMPRRTTEAPRTAAGEPSDTRVPDDARPPQVEERGLRAMAEQPRLD